MFLRKKNVSLKASFMHANLAGDCRGVSGGSRRHGDRFLAAVIADQTFCAFERANWKSKWCVPPLTNDAWFQLLLARFTTSPKYPRKSSPFLIEFIFISFGSWLQIKRNISQTLLRGKIEESSLKFTFTWSKSWDEGGVQVQGDMMNNFLFY